MLATFYSDEYTFCNGLLRCLLRGAEVVADMDDNILKLKITPNLDGKWSRQMTEEELLEYLTLRLNSCLGFRAQVKKLRRVKKSSLPARV